VELRPGGKILLHYKLMPLPKEGLWAYAGEKPPAGKGWGNALPKVVRPLGDFFGSYPVEVQVMLLGVRGMEPFRGIPIAHPRVEIELSGALPLFPGSPFTVQQSAHSSNPNGANANFNGQVLRLRGRVHRLESIELALSIRIIDALPFKRMVGTAEHKLTLNAEDSESDGDDSNDPTRPKKRKRRTLKPIQAKPLTAEELREIATQGMESTESEGSRSSVSETDSDDGGIHDGSETMSVESAEYARRARESDGFGEKQRSFISKAASSFRGSVHSSGKFLTKALSKASSKSYREARRKMKAEEKTLQFDASVDGSGFRKAGSFKGSFGKNVVVRKTGSISTRNSKGKLASVDVYAQKKRDDEFSDSEKDDFGASHKRSESHAKSVASHATRTLSRGLSAIDESELDPGHGSPIPGGHLVAKFTKSEPSEYDPDGTQFTGDPTEEFSTGTALVLSQNPGTLFYLSAGDCLSIHRDIQY
jgi:hypothetical protein